MNRPPGQARAEAPAGIFNDIVGHSPKMVQIYNLIRQVGATKTNVLISGESGTGKELVARAIHQQSPRAGKSFVTINCSAIPENLMESELFGHVKGAFTGAVANKKGLFEIAHEGTVFLDEIGDLSPLIQVKLLRVIQEREFMRVGETQTISVDVRLISATNKNLEQEVIQGKFREDLFYRLNVVHLHLPPLRERREDIPLLAQFFLEKYSKDLGKNVRSISSYALDTLMKYNFPGNVRELENIIERSVALESSNIILPESLVLSEHKKEAAPKSRAFHAPHPRRPGPGKGDGPAGEGDHPAGPAAEQRGDQESRRASAAELPVHALEDPKARPEGVRAGDEGVTGQKSGIWNRNSKSKKG